MKLRWASREIDSFCKKFSLKLVLNRSIQRLLSYQVYINDQRLWNEVSIATSQFSYISYLKVTCCLFGSKFLTERNSFDIPFSSSKYSGVLVNQLFILSDQIPSWNPASWKEQNMISSNLVLLSAAFDKIVNRSSI